MGYCGLFWLFGYVNVQKPLKYLHLLEEINGFGAKFNYFSRFGAIFRLFYTYFITQLTILLINQCVNYN